ncbi:MAG: anti-sigma F factor antagonist [Tissierella sp.]|nr:anti-sigma F factor antagonist [Tissierella sp.]
MEILDNNLIVKLKGELDHHTSEEVRKKIDKQYNGSSVSNIIMDLNELTFMDSSGIGLIMGRYRNTVDKRGKLIIACENMTIKRILDMSGLLKIIELYPKLDEATNNI